MQNIFKKIVQSLQSTLSDIFWQSQNLEYRLLKRGFLTYQNEVIKKGKTFELFVSDYIAEIHNFTCNEQNLAMKTRIHTRVCNIFLLRPDLIKKYFANNTFDHNAYKQLVVNYDKSEIIPTAAISIEEKENQPSKVFDIDEALSKVQAEILKYESGEKSPKHYAHRMFGYLLKEKYFKALNDDQRLDEWQKFTGLESKPEMDYLRNPDSNKNNTSKINQQLKEIDEFFFLIGLKVTIAYHKEKPNNK